MQTDYDYEIAKQERETEKNEQKQDFEIVGDIEPEDVKETKQYDDRVVSKEKQETKENSSSVVASLPEKKEKFVDQLNQEQTKEEKENVLPVSSSESESSKEEEKQQKREVQKVFLNF